MAILTISVTVEVLCTTLAHAFKGTRRGLGAVKRSVGKATSRVSRPFTRKMGRRTRRR